MTDITRPPWAQEKTDLTGRTALVVGGAGGVGEGVVRALLLSGATVVATGRSRDRLHEFAARLDNPALHAEVLDGLDPDLEDVVARMVAEYGAFDIAVVSVASWGNQGHKAALALADAEWDELIAANLTAVFRLYRAVVPALSNGGAFVQLNGMSAEIPFPGAAAVALTAAATKSLTRTVAAETPSLRIYEVILGFIRTRARLTAGVDDPSWIDSTEVGLHVAELAAGTSPLADTVLHYLVDRAAGPQPTPPKL